LINSNKPRFCGFATGNDWTISEIGVNTFKRFNLLISVIWLIFIIYRLRSKLRVSRKCFIKDIKIIPNQIIVGHDGYYFNAEEMSQ